MKSLLWKEFREKRLWLPAILLSIIGPVLLGQGYTFYGPLQVMQYGWIAPSLLVVLFLGFATYSSELSAGTTDLLGSRPVSWKKILTAKLVLGLVLIVPTVLLAAALYRLTCPEAYIRYATPAILGERAGLSMAALFVFYLIGLSCSVVLPGMVGALMVFLAVSIAQGAHLMLMNSGQTESLLKEIPLFSIISWWIGIIVAAMLILRFGITLSLSSRAKKFAVIALAVVPFVAAVDFLPQVRAKRENPHVPPVISLSGSGQYALVNELSVPARSKDFHGVYFVRLSDMKKVRTSFSTDIDGWPYWIGDDAYLVKSATINPEVKDYGRRKRKFWFTAYLSSKTGVPRSLRVFLGQTSGLQYYDHSGTSPDRKLAAIMFTDHVGRRHNEYFLEFIDLERGKKLKTRIKLPTYLYRKYECPVGFEWRPGNVIRFMDPTSKHMRYVKIGN